ncbi:NAD(P)-dependent dehydrogenase, short-chain alcohol dehydrogenase family [Lysobacter sp. yr284]|uniref:SDR family NAD(P)-dependent oxidoreductase n=1 Tax=Lysobacter sp. yr284 TaxID=1761791 RepID=UPI00089AE98E|nr:SDR family NAD(P)-dependent oxidoreductase [Lysobacter sp. yr284]SDZ01517.1 NAD(P)-dependent dehydrogenase, short-chain alcohol dehydrogenase family [Lysobacter sp. yr284]
MSGASDDTRVALVTGGNRGIGLAVCEGFARRGVQVYMGCRDIDEGRAAVKRRELVGVEPIGLDVCSEASMTAAVDAIAAAHGHLDLLVNNAGVSVGVRDKPSEESLAQARATFDVNFFGPWRLSQLALPLMRGRPQAHIINVSSGHGSSTRIEGNNLGYRSSKSALNVLTQSMALELADSGIRVNCMTPGWVRTKLGGIAAPRSPEEGADTILWLALDGGGETGRFYKDKAAFPW